MEHKGLQTKHALLQQIVLPRTPTAQRGSLSFLPEDSGGTKRDALDFAAREWALVLLPVLVVNPRVPLQMAAGEERL